MRQTRAKIASPYDFMDFPDYEFREFPKVVYPDGLLHPPDHAEAHLRGKPMGIEVQSEDEERAVMTAERPMDMEPAGRAELRRQLAQLGVNVDPLWDMRRLYSELSKRANMLAQQFQTVSGQDALSEDPGVVEFGSSGQSETAERYGESFNRQPELDAPEPGRMSELQEYQEYAAGLGIKVDRRWSVGRLKEEIARVTDPEFGADASQV